MFLKNFMQSKRSMHVITILAILFIVVLSFKAGEHFGYRRASFSYGTGDNFRKTFGSEMGPKLMGMGRGQFTNAFGASGSIVSINLPEIVISDRDGTEKTVLVNAKTQIMHQRTRSKSGQLKIGDVVVVFGEPTNDAKISATLIRIMPARQNAASSSATSTKI